MRITPLEPRHRARVADILVATSAFSVDELSIALELFDLALDAETVAPSDARMETLHTSPDYEFVGAFDDEGILCGYACFGPTPATDGTYDLYWLAVEPARQRHGVGRALAVWIEQVLAARGARLLVAETSSRPDYARTRAFYARSGYAEATRVRDFYGPANDRILLINHLAPTAGAPTR